MPSDTPPMNDPHHLFLDTLKRYERPLLRYAHSFINDAEEARDVVQDVFIKLSQNIATLDTERLAPWLFTVCKNRALDHQRKHQRLIPMETETLDLEVAATPQPGHELESRETAATLHSLIAELPDRQREAIRLKFIVGFDYRQISDAMQTSIGNVGYLIHHGVTALRLKWQAREGDIPVSSKATAA